ncbi:MAG: sensor histidine kinase [Ignavibacteriales bacterium]
MARILQSSCDRIVGLGMKNLNDRGFISVMERTLGGEFCREERFYEATSSGAKLWLSLSLSPLRDADGKVIAGMAVVEDITERKQAEEQIKVSLEEKEVLLKEIHHRVKNNLQVISSLLDLQSRYIKDEQSHKIFKESQSRIKSMAFVHEKLYQSKDLARINFAEYIRDLAANLFHSYGVSSTAIKLKITVDNTFLDINTAVPLGLIINELVSNSLKHAFPESREVVRDATCGSKHRAYEEAEIQIDLNSGNHRDNPLGRRYFTLIVNDNGVGFPKDLDFRNTKSLGLRLVRTLTNQLKDNIEIHSNGGTEFKIAFEELKYKERG